MKEMKPKKRFKSNLPPGPGPGRPRGAKNKMNNDIRQEIIDTAQELGFKEWAVSHKDDFFKIIFPRIIPKDINVTGEIWTRSLSDKELQAQIDRLLADREVLTENAG